MTKRPSAQVEADVYFRWKQVRLFLPVQKLPVMLWGCLTLFMSPSVLCGSSWLHPLFKVQLCMRDKVFDSETRSCLLLRLMLLLSLRLSAAHDTISVTGVCYWSHHRIPSHTPKTLNLFLVSVVSYFCLNGQWCCRMAWGEWGLKSDLPLGHLSRKCLFGASILRQKIWFLLFFFLAQNSPVVSILCPQFPVPTVPSVAYHIHIIWLSAACHNSMWRGRRWRYYKPTALPHQAPGIHSRHWIFLRTPGDISISVLWWPKLGTSQSLIAATKTSV